MAYYRRRRRSYARSRYAPRSRYSRGYGSRYRTRGTARYGRRRRSYRARRSSARTIRLVVQTVAASPVAMGMKSQMPVRRMF